VGDFIKALSPKEKANRLRQLVDTAYERASKVNARIDAPLQNPENDPQLGSTDRCVLDILPDLSR
jgi:hypothetical protein